MKRTRTILALALAGVLACSAVAVAATINGTDGPDFLVGTAKNDRINAKGGDDVVFGLGGSDRIYGGQGDDRVDGDGSCPPGATDVTYCSNGGGKGNDHIYGEDGVDTLAGSGGNDQIFGGNGDDDITGGSGADKLKGGNGSDAIDGNSGNDNITGGFGNDDITAGSGNDTINTLDGQVDAVDCGSGRDHVIADKQDDVAKDCEKVTRKTFKKKAKH
jgi:Ca2+-binding RTX toxin-like protein